MDNQKIIDIAFSSVNADFIYKCLLGILGQVRRLLQNSERLINYAIYAICIFTLITVLKVFHQMNTSHIYPVCSHRAIIGIAFPLFFMLRKDLRNIAVTLCLVAMFLSKSWLAIGCIAIAYTFLYWRSHKWLITLLLVLFFIALPVMVTVYANLNDPFGDAQFRLETYKLMLSKWKNIWWGQGFGSFQHLPENQPGARGGLLLAWGHSDLLQGLEELGVIRMLPILCLVLAPLIFFRLDALFNRCVFTSYLCVLFQGLIDFPFHRPTTGLMCLMIITIIYLVRFKEA